MAVVANKRSVMTLYSDPLDIHSHRVRIVLAEKGVNVEILDINLQDKPEDLIDLNPYNTVPTLVDRDLVVYESSIIMEYLDERFPHPPLMPVYPVARAQYRRMMYRLQRDVYPLVYKVQSGEASDDEREVARRQLTDSLLALSPIFADKAFFLSDEFSLVDCCFVPILWRLPILGIELPKQAKHLLKYAKNMFSRPTFQVSLSEAERELRE